MSELIPIGSGDAAQRAHAVVQVDATTGEPVTLGGLPLGAATAANQTTIIGHVDGVETALTAANASLDAIEASMAATGASARQVQGTAADDAAVVGNPVLVGGKYEATPAAVGDGDATIINTDTMGRVGVVLRVPDSASASMYGGNNADGVTASATSSRVTTLAYGYAFNGSTWDRLRGDTGGLYVKDVGNAVSPTDRSGTVTTGGTAQNAAASNASRKGFWIQNNSAAPLTISTVGTASTTAGLVLQPGQLWEMPSSGVSTGAVSVLGATTGQRWDAREW